ncbi:Vegetative incompatibility protein HET-E-1 [Tolypocladium ophioglossoides CBS 100239]|uniref:Vegetative incompatibility protein HET-E-1 n=1 Tax=Tolypocladium ophioglossoides (strain CBS 100239) TaxID=1163406 RepID=A0A0L0NE84_TOLOC|nr:Vegetative incompatibility protein HET-E-1 [Tolypocladium ophioglossoides CBS 100239]
MPSNISADSVTLVVTAAIIVLTAVLVRRNLARATTTRSSSAPRPKSVTFRIDDIPIGHTDELDRNLISIVDKDLALRGVALTIRSLAPYGQDSLCATVSITTTLFGDVLSTQLHQAGKTQPYRYTCKFRGITPLYDAKSNAHVDVIAVPGLGSHALGSWKSPNGDDVWIRDFLPKDLPNIRVLLYGYDTTLPGSLSKQSIEDLGDALLEQIIAFRQNDDTSLRPVIFIGHSLGGLLIKEALVRAHQKANSANSNLSKAVFGLLFFGVPNLGLRNDRLRTLVQGQPNKALIDALLVDDDSEPSTFMKRIADQFSETCKGQYRVVAFFERKLSPTIQVDQDGMWCKSGRECLLVTEKSATSTGLALVSEEDNIALNADHSGLVKYESRGQGDYPVVRERLRRLIDEAKQEVAKRFAEHSLYLPRSETTLACLRSLAFDDMDGRQSKIESAAAGTCAWLLTHETLRHWTRQHRGLLWIKGNPGSGKSTLMKYALQEVPSIYGMRTLALSFFFHGRGHEMQKTPLGLFRSLLHQLLKLVPGAVSDLIDHFEDKRKTESEAREKWSWHLQPLQVFLESSIPKVLKTRPVILFIDALDECGEKLARELIEYLEKLRSCLGPTDSQFGIFFSCRHYPILELESGQPISLDTENSADITTYVQRRFSTFDLDDRIERLICARAKGVFMWARLVLDRVLELERDAEPPSVILAEIIRIPKELDELYEELIKAAKNRSDSLRMMQWICFALRPLTTDELQWAMAVRHACAHKSLDECRHSNDFIPGKKIDKRVKVLSCGLAEIVPSTNAHVVQFIHQSVKDYFVQRGLSLLHQTGALDLAGPAAHYRLSRSCIHYCRMVAVS